MIEEEDLRNVNIDNRILTVIYDPSLDYNYFSAKSHNNFDEKSIYRKNKFIKDETSTENTFTDDRWIYSTRCKKGNITYRFLICEDGTKNYKDNPYLGGFSLPDPLKEIEEKKDKLISKIYFEFSNFGKTRKALAILKTKDGISIFIFQKPFIRDSKELPKRRKFEQINTYSFPSNTQGEISIDEIQRSINILRKQNPNDLFIENVCNELEMFIERKNEHKILLDKNYLVLDSNNLNLKLDFDTDHILDLIDTHGLENTLYKLLETYCQMFRVNLKDLIDKKLDKEPEK